MLTVWILAVHTLVSTTVIPKFFDLTSTNTLLFLLLTTQLLFRLLPPPSSQGRFRLIVFVRPYTIVDAGLRKIAPNHSILCRASTSWEIGVKL